ncbi:hypothetical protein ABTE67_18965, partial [Acinetobacter baumannii]
AFSWVSSVIDGLKQFARSSGQFSRWDASELGGRFSVDQAATLDGALVNCFFPASEMALPHCGALAVTFNPKVQPERQDARTNRMVVEHFTECLQE